MVKEDLMVKWLLVWLVGVFVAWCLVRVGDGRRQ
jgi:hypothetical protein